MAPTYQNKFGYIYVIRNLISLRHAHDKPFSVDGTAEKIRIFSPKGANLRAPQSHKKKKVGVGTR